MRRVTLKITAHIQLEVHGTDTHAAASARSDYGGNHPGLRVCWNSNQTDLLDGGFEAARSSS